MDKYFILAPSEDGLTVSSPLTKDELQERLKENRYLDVEYMNEDTFDWYNLSFHRRNALIIKGKIITPKPKEVVVVYDLD